MLENVLSFTHSFLYSLVRMTALKVDINQNVSPSVSNGKYVPYISIISVIESSI